MIDYLREVRLALIGNRPERCLYVDHAWSRWGPYYPEALEASFYPIEADPGPLEIKAWRRRYCPRCGCEQIENYRATERRIVADPSGIEKRIKR